MSEHLMDYLNTVKPNISTTQYLRIVHWSNGLTATEIAAPEGITASAVQQSIKPIAEAVIAFAQAQ